MAIYHLDLSHGSRSGGQSASAKLDYISREGKYSKQEDVCLLTRSYLPPEYSGSPDSFWKDVDKHERKNGRLFSEMKIALPVELIRADSDGVTDTTKAEDLINTFLCRAGLENSPCTFAIHEGKGVNPHVHIMFSQRTMDSTKRDAAAFFKRPNEKYPERGGLGKDRAFVKKTWLKDTRAVWSEVTNEALQRGGHDARIDHRSAKDRGLPVLPKRLPLEQLYELKNKGLIRVDGGTKGRLSIEKFIFVNKDHKGARKGYLERVNEHNNRLNIEGQLNSEKYTELLQEQQQTDEAIKRTDSLLDGARKEEAKLNEQHLRIGRGGKERTSRVKQSNVAIEQGIEGCSRGKFIQRERNERHQESSKRSRSRVGGNLEALKKLYRNCRRRIFGGLYRRFRGARVPNQANREQAPVRRIVNQYKPKNRDNNRGMTL